jgi:WD40 repeat protein
MNRWKTIGTLVIAALGLGAGPPGRDSDPPPAEALVRLGTGDPRCLGLLGDVAFSPDGGILVSVSESGVVFDDVRTGKEIRRWSSRAVNRMGRDCLSADGRIIGLYDQGEVHFHDLITGQQRNTIRLPVKEPRHLVLSPDGTVLAVLAGTWEIWLVESATGKVLSRLVGHTVCVRTIVFSPDNKRVASGGEEGIAHHWEVASGKLLHRLGKRVQVYGLDWSADGKRLAVVGSPSSPVTVFDTGTGRELLSLDVEEGQSLRFSPRGDLLAVGCCGIFHLFDLRTGKGIRQGGEDLRWIRSLRFSGDGKTLAVQDNFGRLSLWETTTWRKLHPVYVGHRGPVTLVALSPDGKLAATADQSSVIAWEAGTGRLVCELSVRNNWLEGFLTFSADGRLLGYRAANGLHRLWEVGDWKVRQTRDRWDDRRAGTPTSYPVCLAFSADGKQLATLGYTPVQETNTIEIREFATGRSLAAWPSNLGGAIPVMPPGDGTTLAFSRDGRTLLAGGNDGVVREWVTSTGEDRRGFSAHQGVVRGLALSPDGWTLASAGRDGDIRLWETATRKERLQLADPTGSTSKLVFSPDGRLLVAGNSKAGQPLGVWQVSTGQRLGEFRAHDQEVLAVTFSPDGRRLITGSIDKTARIHDLGRFERFRRPARVALLEGEPGPLWQQLGGDDARVAYQAIGKLAAAPEQAVPFLARRLRPARAPEEKRIRALLGDLDGDNFEARRKAEKELEQVGEEGEPVLQRFLQEKPSLEARRRAERVARHWYKIVPTGEALRAVRGVEVLEQIGTPAAREVLRTLGRGLPEARLTREAVGALERLERKHSARR